MRHHRAPSIRPAAPKAPTHIDRLLGLAVAARDTPDDADARRRLADACLAFGLLESAQLDTLGLAVAGRVAQLSDGAVREIADAIDGERARRGRRG